MVVCGKRPFLGMARGQTGGWHICRVDADLDGHLFRVLSGGDACAGLGRDASKVAQLDNRSGFVLSYAEAWQRFHAGWERKPAEQ